MKLIKNTLETPIGGNANFSEALPRASTNPKKLRPPSPSSDTLELKLYEINTSLSEKYSSINSQSMKICLKSLGEKQLTY